MMGWDLGASKLAEGAERWAGKIADLQEAQRLAGCDRNKHESLENGFETPRMAERTKRCAR
jgi:hypothetical protein